MIAFIAYAPIKSALRNWTFDVPTKHERIFFGSEESWFFNHYKVSFFSPIPVSNFHYVTQCMIAMLLTIHYYYSNTKTLEYECDQNIFSKAFLSCVINLQHTHSWTILKNKIPVIAFMNVDRDLLSILKNGSLIGYWEEPHSAVCSRICGTPVLSIGVVLNITL